MRSALMVLMVTPRYFPYMGGVETHVYEAGRRLVENGVDLTLLTTAPHTHPTPLPKEDMNRVRKAGQDDQVCSDGSST